MHGRRRALRRRAGELLTAASPGEWARQTSERLSPILALTAIAGGGALWLIGRESPARLAWAAGAAIVLVPLAASTARSLRHGDLGVDAVALVAIAWALALGQYLAGAIVALMMSGGAALEAWAAGQARRELQMLVGRAPRIAHRHRGGIVEEVQVEELQPGDMVSVRAGEVIPADGVVESAYAVIDESALTGEPIPAAIGRHDQIRSGTTNAGDVFDLRVTRPAAESAYAAIVRLVRAAEGDRARFTRLADRYAAFFLPLSLAVAGIAWAVSGDPTRGLAVMVVATPCPLILAAPIAFVAGLSRAAKAGVIVKGAGALERLGDARSVLLDKTGTLTTGQPAVTEITTAEGIEADEALRLAASLDQMSTHVLAETLVDAARRRGLALTLPDSATEEPGQGISGLVDGRRVAVGSARWLSREGYASPDVLQPQVMPGSRGGARVLVGIDGALAAVLVLEDRLRPGAEGLASELHACGIEHVALVSGDDPAVCEAIARATGIEHVYADQSPEQKLEVVRDLHDRPDLRNVVMVGDGINDAPALALADVGIAMAGKGATISSETADLVVIADNIGRVALAIRIGQRSLAMARQSVLYGLGLSGAAMAVAALGYLPPVWGALFQEAIDVAVILNALRALRG